MAAKALSFDVGDYVVYPKHGVGRVVELQSTEIAGTRLDLYVLRFEKERMTLRVPVNKADSVGMRKLSSDKTMKDALETLKGKPKVKRTMWSRRAQEYEAKINSGDLTSIAEVTRDLFRADDQPEQSYSERQIFEAASSRLARELGAMEQTDEKTALVKILEILNEAAVIHNKAKEAALSVSLHGESSEGRVPDGARPFFCALRIAPQLVYCSSNTAYRRISMRKAIAAAIIAGRGHRGLRRTRARGRERRARRSSATIQVGEFDRDRGRRAVSTSTSRTGGQPRRHARAAARS